MTPETKTKIQEGLFIVALIVAFALGRYSARPPQVKEDTHVETQTVKDVVKDKKTVIVQSPDGTKTTTIDETSRTQTQQNAVTQTTTSVKRPAIVSLTGLAGYDVHTRVGVYGASVTKEIAGPITIGAWGLNNGTIGVSVGVNF